MAKQFDESTIRAEAEAHASFFNGSGNDLENAIQARMAVTRANIAHVATYGGPELLNYLLPFVHRPMTNRDIDNLKAQGRYRQAGQLANLLGRDASYGCHFGMRSSRALAIDEFKAGWQEIETAANAETV